MEPWAELVLTEDDRTRLKNGPSFLAGFGRRVGSGFVAGWTFLAGPPGANPEDLGSPEDAHAMLRDVLARFLDARR